MKQLVVAPSAQSDLLEIADYLDRKAGPRVVARVLTALDDAMRELADGTAVGHPRLDLAPDPARFYLVFQYLIVHRAEPTKVEVSRVLHSARDVRALLA